jgi:eukaryotic-like serine/threonine-protein kinase
MATPAADRNLLFGILALQMDFVGRDALITGMNAWVLAKDKNLGQILFEQGALRADARDLLEALVEKHLEIHGNDPGKSLAALSSLGSARQELAEVPDQELQASLRQVATSDAVGRESSSGPTQHRAMEAAGQDLHATRPPTAGTPTSSGLRFRILRPLARGGLGQVYVACDEELGREVALKEIQDRYADDPNSRARFLLEAEVTGKLEHPGIVPVYGLGTYADGRPFYAMRYIKGDSLQDAIARFHRDTNAGAGDRTLDLRKLLGRFIDVCNAVAYAHSRGVLHRDLKPGNVMLGKYGETLLVDWGLAKPFGQGDTAQEEPPLSPTSASGTAETLPGSAVGTPQYMSPEQAAGRLGDLGPASDVYSLGATLYHLLSGKPPFADGDAGEVLQRVQQGEFPPPRRLRPDVPPALESVCLKAMAQSAQDRYGSPRDLAADLERWLAGEPVSAHPERWHERVARWTRRHRTWVRAGIVALLLVAAFSTAAAILVSHARRKEAEALQRLQEQTARLALDRGLRLCEVGDPHTGLLWLARALKLVPAESEELAWLIRMNLAAWERSCCRLRAVLPHRQAVLTACFDPRTGAVLTGGTDGMAQFWDADSGEMTSRLAVGRGPILAAAFHPRDPLLLLVSPPTRSFLWNQGGAYSNPNLRRLARGSVQVWDPDTRRPRGEPLDHWGQMHTAAVSPDGRWALTGNADNTARLWRLSPPWGPGAEALAHESLPIGPSEVGFGVAAVAFSADGRTMLTGSWHGTARLWETGTGKPLGEPLRFPELITAVAFSPDPSGATIALAVGRKVHVLDRVTRAERFSGLSHPEFITVVQFSPDGRFLLTGCYDGVARLWDTRNGRLRQMLAHDVRFLQAAAFNVAGTKLVTGGWGKIARVWDVPAATSRRYSCVPRKGEVVGGEVYGMALNRDGTRFLTLHPVGSADSAGRLVQVWEVRDGAPRGEALFRQGVRVAALSPNGRTVLLGDSDGGVFLWDGARLRSMAEKHQGAVLLAAFSPDGRTALTAGADQELRLWRVDAGEPLGRACQHEKAILAAAFSPGGRTVISGSLDGTARLWDGSTGEPLGPALPHDSAVSAVGFSHDGTKVFTYTREKRLHSWDIRTHRPAGESLGQRGEGIFCPGGRCFLMVEGDGSAGLRDVRLGLPIGPPTFHNGGMSQTAFSGDGCKLLTRLGGDAVELWDVPAPLAGEGDEAERRVQGATGLELDAGNGARLLDFPAWQERRLTAGRND